MNSNERFHLFSPPRSLGPFPPSTNTCNKLRLKLYFDSTAFTAGSNIRGRLEVTSSAERYLYLGEVAAELVAYEELLESDLQAQQCFLCSRLVFQGEKTPPSNAVIGARDGMYWLAKKGKTLFPFAFQVPLDAPSSVEVGNSAALRYSVCGIVNYRHKGREDITTVSKETRVYETLEDVVMKGERRKGCDADGLVKLEVAIAKKLLVAGQDVFVEVSVTNGSKKSVNGIKLCVQRHVHMLRSGKGAKSVHDTKVVTEVLKEQSFNQSDFCFDAGEERTCILNITIPNDVMSVRYTSLLEITCEIVVTLNSGFFTKGISVELPVTVCHSASVMRPPSLRGCTFHHPNHYNYIYFADDEWNGEMKGKLPSLPRVEIGRNLPWSGSIEDITAGHYSPFSDGEEAASLKRRRKVNRFSNGLSCRGPILEPGVPYLYLKASERSRYLSVQANDTAPFELSNVVIDESSLGITLETYPSTTNANITNTNRDSAILASSPSKANANWTINGPSIIPHNSVSYSNFGTVKISKPLPAPRADQMPKGDEINPSILDDFEPMPKQPFNLRDDLLGKTSRVKEQIAYFEGEKASTKVNLETKVKRGKGGKRHEIHAYIERYS